MQKRTQNAGGSFIVDKNGNKTQAPGSGTVSHKSGDRARNADGQELRKPAPATAESDSVVVKEPAPVAKSSTKKGEQK